MRTMRYAAFMIAAICMAALAGCGKSDKAGESGDAAVVKEAVPPAQPVTIKFGVRSGHMSAEEVKNYVIDPVKKKYPHITVEHVDYDQKGLSFTDRVAVNDIPDIHVQYTGNLMEYVGLGLDYNIEELIKQQKFDLNRVAPEFLETIRTFLMKDHLVGLPIDNNAFGLFYNKNLFDKFGVAYPKDGMTWLDVRELAAKLNRNDSGVQYYGLHPASLFYGARQLALPWLDLKTDKPVFQTQPWKDLFELWYSLYKIPGGELTKDVNNPKSFYDGYLGMIAMYSIFIRDMIKAESQSGLLWDVVTYPTNPKSPGVASSVDSLIANITRTSKYKTEAFQVLSVLLSDEVQTELSRNGRMSVLKDRSIHDQYGKGNPALQSKNVVSMTKLKMATLQPYKYNFKVVPHSMITNVFSTVVFDGKDINTALREADDLLIKEIQTFK